MKLFGLKMIYVKNLQESNAPPKQTWHGATPSYKTYLVVVSNTNEIQHTSSTI
jgi:hypothetical protein